MSHKSQGFDSLPLELRLKVIEMVQPREDFRDPALQNTSDHPRERDYRTLSALCLTSKAFLRIAQPALFDWVDLDDSLPRFGKSGLLRNLASFLETRKEAPGWVRKLTMHSTSEIAQSISWSTSMMEKSSVGLDQLALEDIVCRLPNLHTLVLRGLEFPSRLRLAICEMLYLKNLVLLDADQKVLAYNHTRYSNNHDGRLLRIEIGLSNPWVQDLVEALVIQSQQSLKFLRLGSHEVAEGIYSLAIDQRLVSFPELDVLENFHPISTSASIAFFSFMKIAPNITKLSLRRSWLNPCPRLPQQCTFPSLTEYSASFSVASVCQLSDHALENVEIDGKYGELEDGPVYVLNLSTLRSIFIGTPNPASVTFSSFDWNEYLFYIIAEVLPEVSHLKLEFTNYIEPVDIVAAMGPCMSRFTKLKSLTVWHGDFPGHNPMDSAQDMGEVMSEARVVIASPAGSWVLGREGWMWRRSRDLLLL